jgi:hypothetical protein
LYCNGKATQIIVEKCRKIEYNKKYDDKSIQVKAKWLGRKGT